ncbi:hypothetical protein GXP67_02525 [Rhodocytophaga rosea]|uniref:DUF4185 domain-containing protein n=1 Tax=Rhodocytophaga rosea TaxID=2704465 RepID=A0A6C0GCJ2_9BACT|nr:hypothetical protein [Rhodocytophaga rosea]QHT65617.1 hypothetical protein GXP67_02525 [Rhodocytophaga rosea]
MSRTSFLYLITLILFTGMVACTSSEKKAAEKSKPKQPTVTLIPTGKFYFNSFVDCNMAEAWVGDTFRIFPGKYGEDPLWGNARELKFADGQHADEAFSSPAEKFTEPVLPKNAPVGTEGLHGAVWFETIYQDTTDASGKTLFAIYHNENYPQTLPYDANTGQGYIDKHWPQGLTGKKTPAAVCRIGVMKSVDGGRSWANKGLFIEDLQARMILKPHNNSVTFAGGVGDPSAVASGDYLYLFYGEYGYPGTYDSLTYDPAKEWSGQCVSMARIKLSDLENPEGKARRWDGNGFNAAHNGIGQPIASLQIPIDSGGPASSATGKYYWGPSVSWNYYLNSWVMLMARAEGPSWKGSRIYISYNPNKDLSTGNNSQQWTKPELLIDKPGHILWYPSLQPLNSPEDIGNKNTSLKLGQHVRLFYKDQSPEKNVYWSEFQIKFEK